MMKRIGQVIGITLFVMWGLVQCARNDIAVRDPATGEFQSLFAHWFADDIQRLADKAFPTSTPWPTLIPTATPATAHGRVDAYFKELKITLTALDRNVTRIENYREDKYSVAMVGPSVFMAYSVLRDMPVPSKADTLQLGIEEDYEEAHKWLMNTLFPCFELGAHAQYDEQNDEMVEAILASHEVCKERVAHLKEMLPDFFVCPEDEFCG